MARRHALTSAEPLDIHPQTPTTPADIQSTASGSALKTVRETELYGGLLSAGLSREYLYINAEFLKGDE